MMIVKSLDSFRLLCINQWVYFGISGHSGIYEITIGNAFLFAFSRRRKILLFRFGIIFLFFFVYVMMK